MAMNILFFLTPKANCAYLETGDTIRQAIEKMSAAGYTALPILAADGSYCGTLTEGDLLRAMRDLRVADFKQTESHTIQECRHQKDNRPVNVLTDMEDLMSKATEQNFVPVVDDKGAFIGIVTRKVIMQYCMDTYMKPKKKEAVG